MFFLKIFACFRFRSHIFTFITCPVNSFILWDEFSVEKSVIWVVFGKQMLIIRNALPLPLATGRKFDICHHLITLLIIANSISSKNPKIFVPHQFSVKFMSKEVDKLKKILFSSQKFVINPKMTKFCLENYILCYFS